MNLTMPCAMQVYVHTDPNFAGYPQDHLLYGVCLSLTNAYHGGVLLMK